jgi:hypothetical protein
MANRGERCPYGAEMSEKDFVALLEGHLSNGAMYEIHNLADALCSVLTKEKLEQLVSQINWNVSK